MSRSGRLRREPPELVASGDLGRGDPWPSAVPVEAVVRALEPLVFERRRERILAAAAARLGGVTVLMDAPQDPHNTAAVLRSCDAFGLQALHVLPGGEAPFDVSAKIALGSQRWVDIIPHGNAFSALRALRAEQYILVATHPEGALCPEALRGFPRLALMLGNETHGLRPELAAAAEHTVRVPMRGFVESLNLSVSAGILLAAAVGDREGDLSPLAQRRLYARGLFHTVSRASEVLEECLRRELLDCV